MNKDKVIGVYIGGFDSLFPQRMLRGIEVMCREKGVKLVYVSAGSEDVQSRAELFLRQDILKLLHHGIDGLIVMTAAVREDSQFSSEIRRLKESLNIPILFLGSPLPDYESIEINNKQAFYDMVYKVLSSAPRRRPVYLSGPEKHDFAQDRGAGYFQALEDLGYAPEEQKSLFLDNMSMFSGRNGVKKLLKEGVPFDTLFCMNDELALGALLELSEQGIRVPEEVWITGFDNVPDTISSMPEITTVERKGLYVGMEGVLRLLGEVVGYSDYYPHSLEFRGTTPEAFQRGKQVKNPASLREIAMGLRKHFAPPFPLDSFPSADDWLNQFLRPFVRSLHSKEKIFFEIGKIIHQPEFRIVDLSQWHSIIDYLRHFSVFLSSEGGIEEVLFLERLWAVQHFIINHNSLREHQETLSFSELNQRLSVAASQYSMLFFLDTLAREVPSYGVCSLSISFWEDKSRGLLREAFRLDGEDTQINWPEGRPVHQRELWEEYSRRSKEHVPLFLPLFGSDESFGILVIETEKPLYLIIESLRAVISVALRGAHLVAEIKEQSDDLEIKVRERTKELQNLNKKLKIEMLDKESINNRLEVSERRYRKFFEDDLTGDFIVDLRMRVVDCNRAFARIFGFPSPDFAIGTNFRTYFSSYKEQRRLVKLFFHMHQLEYLETQLVRPDGEKVDVIANVAGVFDSQGRLSSIKGYIFDNTPRKHLERQLQQSQKMEGLGRLAGGIAHDFNNLLTIINGYSELMIGELSQDFPFFEDLQEISKAGQKAASLTSQLLAFSRREAVKHRLIPLNSVVKDMGNLFHRLLGEPIEFSLDLKADPDGVKADKGQVEQILMNLVLNAKDALSEGGQLSIKTETVDLGETSYNTDELLLPGLYVRLSVIDDGVGMDQATQDQIFEPFFTTKEKGKGTGLGMSMVYGIIKQMGGYLEVHSSLGQGARFDIYFLAETMGKEAVLPIDRQSPIAAKKRSRKILLVEDEVQVREFTLRLLRRAGFEVEEAYNGKMALLLAESFKETPFLLTDVIMPGMSGPELASILKKDFPDMKILFISGYTDDQIKKQGISEDEVHLIHKPFKSKEILDKIEEMLLD